MCLKNNNLYSQLINKSQVGNDINIVKFMNKMTSLKIKKTHLYVLKTKITPSLEQIITENI